MFKYIAETMKYYANLFTDEFQMRFCPWPTERMQKRQEAIENLLEFLKTPQEKRLPITCENPIDGVDSICGYRNIKEIFDKEIKTLDDIEVNKDGEEIIIKNEHEAGSEIFKIEDGLKGKKESEYLLSREEEANSIREIFNEDPNCILGFEGKGDVKGKEDPNCILSYKSNGGYVYELDDKGILNKDQVREVAEVIRYYKNDPIEVRGNVGEGLYDEKASSCFSLDFNNNYLEHSLSKKLLKFKEKQDLYSADDLNLLKERGEGDCNRINLIGKHESESLNLLKERGEYDSITGFMKRWPDFGGQKNLPWEQGDVLKERAYVEEFIKAYEHRVEYRLQLCEIEFEIMKLRNKRIGGIEPDDADYEKYNKLFIKRHYEQPNERDLYDLAFRQHEQISFMRSERPGLDLKIKDLNEIRDAAIQHIKSGVHTQSYKDQYLKDRGLLWENEMVMKNMEILKEEVLERKVQILLEISKEDIDWIQSRRGIGDRENELKYEKKMIEIPGEIESEKEILVEIIPQDPSLKFRESGGGFDSLIEFVKDIFT